MTSLSDVHGLRIIPETDLRRPIRSGVVAFALLVGAFGGWSATTEIGGAVVSGGQAVVQGKPQLVQSLDGGIVREIAIRNGDRVEAGQVLLRLDPTLVETNLGIAQSRLADALALRARLEAEQAGLAALEFRYPDLPFAPPDTGRQEQAQALIFAARAEVLAGSRAQLGETIGQFEAQIAGIEAQIAAKREQAASVAEDLANMTRLSENGLVRERELNETQRAAADLQGQIASLEAEIAGLRIAMRDAEIATRQEERGFREGVASELREAQAKVDELTLEIVTRSAELDRVEIRSPANGIVHEMEVATVGGVVEAGATLLQVMPLDQGLEFEIRVDPRAIDQVHVGQAAQLVIAPLDPRSTPKLEARVASVSAAAVTEAETGQSYYRVTLAVTPEEIARLGDDVTLAPGMPVEAYLETGNRTVLAYLLHPIASHMQRAFRED